MSVRIRYFLSFLVLLAVEVCIALFVRDRFLRPYGGDVLVTVLLCCLGRVIRPGLRGLPGYVFLLAVLVEVGQFFHLVDRTGLGRIPFFRILLGSTFSWADLVCYGAGCLLFWTAERILQRKA